jgi:hypothetical protein
MADMGQHLVPADTTAKLYDQEMLLETKKSQLVRIEQDIKDITNIALKAKERERHMTAKDIEECKRKIALLQQQKLKAAEGDDKIIDV